MAALAAHELSLDIDKFPRNCDNFNGNLSAAALDDDEFSVDRYNFWEDECQLGGKFRFFSLG